MAYDKIVFNKRSTSGKTEKVNSYKKMSDKVNQHDDLIKTIIVVICLAFIALVFSYFSMLRDVYKEYASALSLLNSERMTLLEQRIDKLENRRR